VPLERHATELVSLKKLELFKFFDEFEVESSASIPFEAVVSMKQSLSLGET
jgi:hypothetical protein